MRRTSTPGLALLWVVALLALTGCRGRDQAENGAPASPMPTSPTPGQSAPPADQAVSLQLNWFPEAEHGGFFAALALNHFKEAGLDVTILPGGPGVPIVPAVATGKATFGVINADSMLLGREQGADVVALMAPIQNSPRCIMVHAGSGIERLEQLQDITLSMDIASPFAKYLQKHLPLTNVRTVPYTGNVTQFLADPKMAQQAYSFSEPLTAREQGAETRNLMVMDVGYNTYTSVLIANRELIRTNPELVRKMTQACVKGWRDYLHGDSEATHALIQERNPAMTQDTLAFGLDALLPLTLTPEVEIQGLGFMTLERWSVLVRQLEDLELIKAGALNPAEAFEVSFLK